MVFGFLRITANSVCRAAHEIGDRLVSLVAGVEVLLVFLGLLSAFGIVGIGLRCTCLASLDTANPADLEWEV